MAMMTSKRTTNVWTGALVAMALASSLDAATNVTLGEVATGRPIGGTWNNASQGTFSIGAHPFPTSDPPTVNTGTVAMSLTGLTIDTESGIDLTWDLRITASAGDGVVLNGNNHWTVGPANDTRIDSGEALTFTVENIASP